MALHAMLVKLLVRPSVSTTHFVAGLLLLTTFLLAAYSFHQIYLHPLRAYPGPLLAKLTNLHRLYHYYAGSIHTSDASLFARHASPVLRVGPSRLIFSSAEAFRAIHGQHANIERGDFYTMTRFADGRECSVATAGTNVLHREKRRRLVGVGMTPAAFKSYEEGIGWNVDRWVGKVEGLIAEEGESVDLALPVKALGLDVVFTMLVGEPVGCLDMWRDPRFRAAVAHKEDIGRDCFGFGLIPWFPKFISWVRFPKVRFRRERYNREGLPIGNTLLLWLPLKRAAQVLLPAVEMGSVASPSLLSHLADLSLEDSRKMRCEEEIMTEITNMMFAGPGTTTATLMALLYDLATHEEWQEKLYEEIARLPDDSATSFESGKTLDAFMKESMRLRPAGPGVFEREIAHGAEEAVPHCYGPLPVGTSVGAVIYVVNRDKSIYGPDADVFRPERWLDASPDLLWKMKGAMATFGHGAKKCPGERGAMMVLQKCVAGVLRRWHVSAGSDGLVGRNNFEMSYKHLRVTLRQRKSVEAGY